MMLSPSHCARQPSRHIDLHACIRVIRFNKPKGLPGTVQAPVKLLRSCQRNPAACVRHRLDDDEVQSATDEDWDFNGEPASAKAPAGAAVQLQSEERALENQESLVLNGLVPGAVGRVPTYASRSSVSISSLRCLLAQPRYQGLTPEATQQARAGLGGRGLTVSARS